jgi:hypothetical protein
MKRRRFIQAIASAPAAPVLVAQQRSLPSGAAARPGQEIPPIASTALDVAADMVPRFFNAQQFAALRKLSETLMPPLKGNPGALEANAPEFLDFLIGVSPAERQQLYRNGLDTLNAQATKLFGKSFAEVDAAQADAILKPLFVAMPPNTEPPVDPLRRFVAQAHTDIRTATTNSREWSLAATAGGRRGGGGTNWYWYPIDPVVR